MDERFAGAVDSHQTSHINSDYADQSIDIRSSSLRFVVNNMIPVLQTNVQFCVVHSRKVSNKDIYMIYKYIDASLRSDFLRPSAFHS